MEAIAAVLPEALFIAIHRDLTDNARSILDARMGVTGAYDAWWSVEPPGIERIRQLPTHEQAVEQVRALNALVERVESSIGSERVLHLAYEDLCSDTHTELERVTAFAAAHGSELGERGDVPATFLEGDGDNPVSPELEAALVGYVERL